jgi:phosphatidylethanolamine-binding protein (PEBP) family uncharacterized protein
LTAPWTAKDTCTPEARDTCDNIPVENRSNFIGGGDVMPTITWTAGPEGTQGYALVFQDLSNPMQMDQPRSVHWAIWGIPSEALTVGPGAMPEGSSEAAWVGDAWFGSGNCNNVYELIVYALSGPLTPQGDELYTEVRDQLEGDDGALVLARDYARVTPQAPCGN